MVKKVSIMMRALPIVFFVFSLSTLAFFAGVTVVDQKVFPYPQLRDGVKTIRFVAGQLFGAPYVGAFDQPDAQPGPLVGLAGRRFRALAPERMGAEPVVIVGGLNQYRDQCPEFGCLAVTVDRTGAIIRAAPFLPEAILAADATRGAFAREGLADRPELIIRPIGAAPYPDGDLLVTFQSIGDGGAFPFSMGVGRIAPDGTPRWFRFDYSHHWATLLPDGRALVPSLEVASAEATVVDGDRRVRLRCESGRPQIDHVEIFSPDGAMLRRIDIFEQLATGPWSMALQQTINGCDPLHLNYVDIVGADDAPEAGLVAGDLVVSLRNISAIAVLDGESGAVKRVVRGGFAQQHAVHHLAGSKLLMFDNWGGDAVGRPSRLLEIDLATGGERRVFPPEGDFEGETQFSRVASHLDISQDRRRVVVAFSEMGRIFEVDIATGEALMTFDGLHDLSGVAQASDALREGAARGQIFGVYYAP